MNIVHPIPPLFDESCQVLILGSFPSEKSRKQKFFYGHPQNRFWKVLASVYGSLEPKSVDEKKAFLLSNHIALWDVIKSCEITGSADSSIKNVVVNDLSIIFNSAKIEKIIVNGKTAQKYYTKYIEPIIGKIAICLPSTSAANATYSLSRLIDEWKIIKSI